MELSKPKDTINSTSKHVISAEQDQLLIRACKQGDQTAEQQLFDKYYGILLPIGRRYLRYQHVIEEAIHLTFIKVFDAIAHNTLPIHFESWIKKIMVNHCINQLRTIQRFRRFEQLDSDIEVSLEPQAIAGLQYEDIMNCLEQLDDKERIVFCLHTIDGYKHAEIGDQLHISAGTSRWYLNQAKKKLKHLITKLQ